MVGRSLDQKDEMWAYIKARSKIGCSFTAYRPSCLSYDSVKHWKKKFESGVESMKMH